jgi:hypothetical protein
VNKEDADPVREASSFFNKVLAKIVAGMHDVTKFSG